VDADNERDLNEVERIVGLVRIPYMTMSYMVHIYPKLMWSLHKRKLISSSAASITDPKLRPSHSLSPTSVRRKRHVFSCKNTWISHELDGSGLVDNVR
jgi:hypothetical protein